MQQKKPTRPVFERDLRYQRRSTPQRPVFSADKASSGVRQPPRRMDYTRAVPEQPAKRQPPARMDFHYYAQPMQKKEQPDTQIRKEPFEGCRAQTKQGAHGVVRSSKTEETIARAVQQMLNVSQRAFRQTSEPAAEQTAVAEEAGLEPAAPKKARRVKKRQKKRKKSIWKKCIGYIIEYWRSIPPPTPEQLQQRRRIRKKLVSLGLAVVVLSVGTALFEFLFQVKQVHINKPEGGLPYTDQAVIDAFGKPFANNLFGFSKSGVIEKMETALPYLEVKSIHRKPPGEVVIETAVAQERMQVECSTGGWAVLSQDRKVLRVSDQMADPSSVVLVRGLKAVNAEPGQMMQSDSSEKEQELINIWTQAQKVGLWPLTEIDVSDSLELNVLLQNRLRIILGTSYDMTYKLDWAYRLAVMPTGEGLAPDAMGTLNVSARSEEGRGKAVFLAQPIESPYVPPPEPPAPEPELEPAPEPPAPEPPPVPEPEPVSSI